MNDLPNDSNKDTPMSKNDDKAVDPPLKAETKAAKPDLPPRGTDAKLPSAGDENTNVDQNPSDEIHHSNLQPDSAQVVEQDLPTMVEAAKLPAAAIEKIIVDAEKVADHKNPSDGIHHPHLHPVDAEQKEAMETSIGVVTALEVGAHRPSRLYRSRVDRQLAGVCGGIGERMNMDPNMVRVLMLLLFPFTFGLPLFAYLFLSWRLHVNPEHSDEMVRESLLIPQPGAGWASTLIAVVAFVIVICYLIVSTYLVIRAA